MIIASDHGDVCSFGIARTAFGRGLYWTGVHLARCPRRAAVAS